MIQFVGWLLGELLAAGRAHRTIRYVGWMLRELLAAGRARLMIQFVGWLKSDRNGKDEG
jgi:hypothetical protein